MRRRKFWRSVGCKVARDIADSPGHWSYGTTSGVGQAVIETGCLRVTVTPCERCPCLRLFDQVRLYDLHGQSQQDVFIGPVSRLCLRRAVRRFTAQNVAAGL
jgi:hypothetical protein